jgi:hypothetical protein
VKSSGMKKRPGRRHMEEEIWKRETETGGRAAL